MTFQGKVRARMIAALKLSGGTWLPELHPAAKLADALAAVPESVRVALDASGDPMTGGILQSPVTIDLGPEGGIEPDELEQVRAAGFRLASLGPTTLRFETAGTVALGIDRADRRWRSRPLRPHHFRR